MLHKPDVVEKYYPQGIIGTIKKGSAPPPKVCARASLFVCLPLSAYLLQSKL
jgi:hypothetical protein